MPRPENKFPTLRDVSETLAKLVEDGLGELPTQVVVVPDSTLQAIARLYRVRADDKPALMVGFDGVDGRIGVTIVATERLEDAPPVMVQ